VTRPRTMQVASELSREVEGIDPLTILALIEFFFALMETCNQKPETVQDYLLARDKRSSLIRNTVSRWRQRAFIRAAVREHRDMPAPKVEAVSKAALRRILSDDGTLIRELAREREGGPDAPIFR
jgi:hypothetical protein